jgi:ADP-heptose:LPS heptosyltransferase
MLEYTRERIRQLSRDISHRVFLPQVSTGSKQILVVQMEGLGNAILTTPLISALSSLSPQPTIDVLVDASRGSDVAFQNWSLVRRVWDLREMDSRSGRLFYDVVLECHPRKDLPRVVRYAKRLRICVKPRSHVEYHWCFQKHEADYLVDLARSLGFHGERPPIRKLVGEIPVHGDVKPNTVAIGIGYLKRPRADGRDWSDRHWGNENFALLCTQLKDHGYHPVLIGDRSDFEIDGRVLVSYGIESVCGRFSLPELISYLGQCVGYVGNDTGLMHVAAAVGIPTVGIFVATNSVKSYPLGSSCIALGGDRGPQRYLISVEEVLSAFFTLINKCFD